MTRQSNIAPYGGADVRCWRSAAFPGRCQTKETAVAYAQSQTAARIVGAAEDRRPEIALRYTRTLMIG